jgi:YYY domain-containing protein
MRDALAWYIVVQVAGLAVWPLVSRALAPLEDRGWAASKVAGLLGVAWLVWFVCMLAPVPFTRTTLLVALVGLGAGAWLLELRTGGIEPVLAWLSIQRRLVLSTEVLFLAGFVLFAVLRAHAPAVAATEKPMDMAFLSGFMTAQGLPTQDTWLAGFSVPYYHFGYFVLACLGKVTGASPGVAYNLAAATVPALAMVSLASLAWNLARAAGAAASWAVAGSGLATLLGLFCGNLSTLFEYLLSRGIVTVDASVALGINPKHFGNSVIPGVWPPTDSFWWFNASRVIPNLQPDGIDEFPFFSALLSDLHPHFMALPFELLVLTIAAVHVLSRGATLRSVATQGLAALALGGLLVINTWDIAPFWLLYIGLSLYAAYFSQWRWRWLAAALSPLAGGLVYAPYFVGYAGPPLGLGIVTGDRTPLASLLVLFGWAIALLTSLGLFTRWCIGDRRGWQITASGAILGVALTVLGQPGLGLLVTLVALLLPWPGVLERFEPAAAMVVGIGAFAAIMLLGVEIVFLDDVFHSRMNTVFKFHENAWLLAGLASGVGLALVGRFTLRARWIVAACAAVFLVAGMVYPLSAIATRMRERPPDGPSLDGIAFLSPDDRAAVRWLSDQNGPRGRVVIAEGVGDEYDSSAAAMSTYSGAATVVGWAGHELQWRGPLPELGSRQSDLAALYRDAPVDAIRGIVDRYGVRFVVVRDVERKKYGDTVTSRFEGVLPVAFRAGSTVIYRAR